MEDDKGVIRVTTSSFSLQVPAILSVSDSDTVEPPADSPEGASHLQLEIDPSEPATFGTANEAISANECASASKPKN
jgi:hypothetical protein